jgi:hypothetical protein
VLPERVAGASKKITGVRPGRRTISAFSPLTGCVLTQSSASVTTRSIKPCRAQSASNIGLFAGTAM